MRRKFLCALAAALLLTSCAARLVESPTPTATDILTPEEAAAHCAQVLLDSQSDGESYRLLSPEDIKFYLSEVYGIPEDSRGGAALVYTAGGVDARELAVIYGTNDVAGNTAAAALEAYRQNREGDFTGYAPDQEALVKQGLVMEGNIALLMICTDPGTARKAMEELSHLVIEPFDPDEEAPEPYDWTDYVNEKGWKLFDPPNEFDMTPYDTSAILTAWDTGDESGLSEKDAAILAKCREIFGAYITEDMTDFQKEVALHDWLVDQGSYDQTVHDPQTPMGREDNANPYGMLVNRYGICLGYATTFQLFMDLAGVECITVVGASAASSSDHAWNMVKLEGEWYCVDPTWDDSTIPHPEAYTQEELSRRHHHYFNVTSQDLRGSDHQWDYENIPEATAARFRWDGTGPLPQ